MFFLNTRVLPVGGGVVVGGPEAIKIIDQNNAVPSLAALTAAISGRDVLLITHGFNVNQANGIEEIMNWAGLLGLGNAVPIGILWPGDSRWIHVVDYPIEGNEAMSAGNLLAAFLNKNFTSALSLSFASHSLGARVVLQTVAGLNRSVRRLLLMAGAIDNTCLGNEYTNAAKNVGTISLLASRSDNVLKWAFPAGNFVSGLFSRGTPYVHEAIGREGPSSDIAPPSNLHADWQIPDDWNFDHGDYLPAAGAPAPMPPVTAFPGPNPASKPAWTASFETSRWT
jgi:pimeloyl-ACP methyl ester carboxylesterase